MVAVLACQLDPPRVHLGPELPQQLHDPPRVLRLHDDHAPNPRNLGGYGEYFRSEARSFVHRSPVRTSNNTLPLVGYPQ